MTTIGSSYLAASLTQLRATSNVSTSTTTVSRALASTQNITLDGSRTLLLKQNLNEAAELIAKVDVTNDALDGIASRLQNLETLEAARNATNSGSAEYDQANSAFDAAHQELSAYILNNVTSRGEWKIVYDDTPNDDTYFDFESWANGANDQLLPQLAAIEVKADGLLTKFHSAATCPMCQAGDGIAAAPTTNTTTVVSSQSDPSTTNANWDSLRSGSLWNISGDQQLSYSYYSGAVPYTYAGNGPNGTVTPLDAGQQADHDVVFQRWDEVVQFEFQRLNETSASNVGEIRVAYSSAGPAGSAAYAYYPNQGPSGGDTWYMSSVSSNDSFAPGTYGMLTALHELGHAIGLKHPFSAGAGPILSAALDNARNSVMTYTQDDRNMILSFTRSGNSISMNPITVQPITPMLYDVAFAQENYGTESSVRNTNTSYTFSTAPEVLQTIVDGGGTDTMDLTGITRGSIINLAPGSFSSVGYWSIADQKAAAQAANPGFSAWIDGIFSGMTASNLYQWDDNVAIANSATIENAIGGSGADTITGNTVDNEIWGMNGNDTISGAGGDDTAGFRGAFTDYTIGSGASFTVQDNTAGRDGTDTVTGIKFLKFSDGVYDAVTRQKVGAPSGIPFGNNQASSGNSASAAAEAATNATQARQAASVSRGTPSPTVAIERTAEEKKNIMRGRMAGLLSSKSKVSSLSGAASRISRKMAHVSAAISSPVNRTGAMAPSSVARKTASMAQVNMTSSLAQASAVAASRMSSLSVSSAQQSFNLSRADVLAAILRA